MTAKSTGWKPKQGLGKKTSIGHGKRSKYKAKVQQYSAERLQKEVSRPRQMRYPLAKAVLGGATIGFLLPCLSHG